MFFRIRSPYLHQFCNENSSITIGSIAIGAETTGYCGNLGRDDASHPALSNMHRSEPYKDAYHLSNLQVKHGNSTVRVVQCSLLRYRYGPSCCTTCAGKSNSKNDWHSDDIPKTFR